MVGRPGWPIGHRWSKQKTPSIPSSSTRLAAAMAVSASSLNWGRVTPILTARSGVRSARSAPADPTGGSCRRLDAGLQVAERYRHDAALGPHLDESGEGY